MGSGTPEHHFQLALTFASVEWAFAAGHTTAGFCSPMHASYPVSSLQNLLYYLKEGDQMLVRPHHPLHWDKTSSDPFTFGDVTGSSRKPQKMKGKEVQKYGGTSE